MARYKADVQSDRSLEETFAYLSDFSSAADWDPGVVEAQRIGAQAIGDGSAFRIVASFLGRRTTLEYRIVEYDPPRAVTFRGANATVVSIDRLTFEPSGTGTRVTYAADLELQGPWRLLEPLFARAFRRVGDRALAGLRQKLGSEPPR